MGRRRRYAAKSASDELARRSYSQPPDTIADAWEPPGQVPGGFLLGPGQTCCPGRATDLGFCPRSAYRRPTWAIADLRWREPGTSPSPAQSAAEDGPVGLSACPAWPG